jgi:hypothetical protein
MLVRTARTRSNVSSLSAISNVLRFDEFDESVKHRPIDVRVFGGQQGRIAEQRFYVWRYRPDGAGRGRMACVHGVQPRSVDFD